MEKLDELKKKFILDNFPNRYSETELANILDVNLNVIKHFIFRHMRGHKRSQYWCKDKLQWLYDYRYLQTKFEYQAFNKVFKIPTSYESFLYGLKLMRKELRKNNGCIVKDNENVMDFICNEKNGI